MCDSFQKYLSEFFGTLLLVFLGCGSAVIAGTHIGFIGVSLAFGLTLLVLAYALGPISGCHLNPAVTLTMVMTRRMKSCDVIGYIVAQIAGAVVGAGLLYVIASGKSEFQIINGFALNGFGAHSPTGYNLMACLVAEIIGTTILLYAILATTHKGFAKGFGGIVVGSTLLVLHLFLIPITNASVNIARSIGPAIFHGGWALEQLWLFGVAHIIAIILCVIFYNLTHGNEV